MQKAIFLDRDGTLNKDVVYLKHPSQVEWIKHSFEALKILKDLGYVFCIISNQSGVARNLITKQEVDLIHDWMHTELLKNDIEILEWAYCPHHPDFGSACDCRKPNPKMILDCAQKHKLDTHHSFMIGDALRDVQAGLKAGCKVAALRSGKEPEVWISYPQIPCYNTLYDFALEQKNANRS